MSAEDINRLIKKFKRITNTMTMTTNTETDLVNNKKEPEAGSDTVNLAECPADEFISRLDTMLREICSELKTLTVSRNICCSDSVVLYFVWQGRELTDFVHFYARKGPIGGPHEIMYHTDHPVSVLTKSNVQTRILGWLDESMARRKARQQSNRDNSYALELLSRLKLAAKCVGLKGIIKSIVVYPSGQVSVDYEAKPGMGNSADVCGLDAADAIAKLQLLDAIWDMPTFIKGAGDPDPKPVSQSIRVTPNKV